jgi:hypothetical protein
MGVVRKGAMKVNLGAISSYLVVGETRYEPVLGIYDSVSGFIILIPDL